ncbi:MAG: hypothetical protein HRU11_10360 [Parvularculaceae bacterium]|nr:hypothetical protein [Parvularculaceae bacterium]
MNAGIYWEDANERVDLSVHVTNLTDERYIVGGYDFVSSVPELGNNVLGTSGVLTAFYGDPRRVMGTVEVRF